MPMYVAVQTPADKSRPNRSASGPAANVPAQTFHIALYQDGSWNCQKPIPQFWRYIMPDTAMGSWYRDIADTLVLMDPTGNKIVFELRTSGRGSGVAFLWPRKGNRGATLYDGEGSWGPSSLSYQKSWVGLVVKGGGGFIAGAEGALGYVVNLNGPRSSALLRIGTARAGIVGGGSAGLALLFCTGFNSIMDMNYSFGGWDFALAIGPKWSAIAKASASTSKITKALVSFDGGIEAIGTAMTAGQQGKLGKVLSELPGAGKSVVGGYGMLVDTDEKNIVAIDIPFAGYGTELGVYYGWSRATVQRQWK